MTDTPNLFEDLPPASIEEDVAVLLERPGVMIERILSTGQASPPGFWYDQNWSEWVLLLTGAARLRFEDEQSERILKPGDCLTIAPHRRHRLEWTQQDPPTLWLAVHMRESEIPA